MWSTGLRWTKCCKVFTHVELQCINFAFIKSLEFYTLSGHLCSINSCVYAAATPVVPSTASVTSVSPSLCSRPCQLRDRRYSAARRGTHTKSSRFLTYIMLHVECPNSLPAEEWRATSILDLGTIAPVWVSTVHHKPQSYIHTYSHSITSQLGNIIDNELKTQTFLFITILLGWQQSSTDQWILWFLLQRQFYMLHGDETTTMDYRIVLF